MEYLIEFINHVIENMNNFKDNSDTYWERIVLWLMITYIEIKTTLLELAYDLASTLIAAMNISDAINAAWSGISGDTLAVLSYLRIPESINMILSAFVTRFIMGMLP